MVCYYHLNNIYHLADACKRVCGYNYDPVCGSDRVKYDNRCLFEVANCTAGGSLTIIQEGPCPKRKCIVSALDGL